METDTAKADFAKGVASKITGVDESDVKNIVVTEIFTQRRRLQSATGVSVAFDIEVDTNSAQNAGVGDGTAAALFNAVAGELNTAVSDGGIVTALNAEGSFSNLDASYTSSNFDSSAVTYSATSVATPGPTPQPSAVPTPQPSPIPTLQPSSVPTLQPTSLPTLQPSALPTPQPSPIPTPQPTSLPTLQPSSIPTLQPSAVRIRDQGLNSMHSLKPITDPQLSA